MKKIKIENEEIENLAVGMEGKIFKKIKGQKIYCIIDVFCEIPNNDENKKVLRGPSYSDACGTITIYGGRGRITRILKNCGYVEIF